MLEKENEEENKLINLQEYYSNFFYKNKKFKQTFKAKLLDSREYLSKNPKIHFLFEILFGFIFFGFPGFYFFNSIPKSKINENKIDFFSFTPLIIISFIFMMTLVIILGFKIRRILKNGL